MDLQYILENDQTEHLSVDIVINIAASSNLN